MSVYRLTNAQWEYIRLLLLVRPRLRGCLPADNRQTLEAILHVLTTRAAPIFGELRDGMAAFQEVGCGWYLCPDLAISAGSV